MKISTLQPIGVFDSGIGGLTVANAILDKLPNERIIYFGDTKHLPYGEKSPQAIVQYSLQIVDFLIQEHAKIIVIACNSASTAAFEVIQKQFGHKVKIINVIDPLVKIVQSKALKHVGIIGTNATINSHLYPKKIKELSPFTQTESLATPLLAPMIEEGFIENSISEAIIHNYLTNSIFNNIQALLLACTHYPLITNQISKFFNFNVEILNSNLAVANEVKMRLGELNLLNSEKNNSYENKFYVSDWTASFHQTAAHFFGKEIELIQKNIV